MHHVIVIGGGLAGVTAAASAARSTSGVLLLEAQRSLGGRASTDRIGDFALLRGPHALYRGGSGERVLRALGALPAGRAPSTRHHRLLRGGALVPPPYDLSRPGPRALVQVVRWLRAAAREDQRDRTAAAWLAGLDGRDDARELLTALVRTSMYTSALDEVPAAAAVAQTRRAVRAGVLYLDGGWQPLVERLADLARTAGARVRTRAKVAGLLDGGRGVRLADGETIPARAVVIAGLGPGAAGRLLESAGGATPVARPRPVEAACLDVALGRLPRRDQRFVIGVDEPLLLSELTRAARRSAPSGGAVVHVARYLRDDRDRADRGELEALLDLAQPGWRDHVHHARFLPRMTVVEHLGPPVGVDATGLPGVLLAGDWVGGGWLADASLDSGAAAGMRAAALATATARGTGVLRSAA